MLASMGIKLVAKKKECGDGELHAGDFYTISECRDACKGKSSLFIFGRAGTARCKHNNKKCRCYCETSASQDGKCTQKDHGNYNLYGYTAPTGKFVVTNRKMIFSIKSFHVQVQLSFIALKLFLNHYVTASVNTIRIQY